MGSPNALYEELSGWVENAHSLVAFTGAGISTESGIPDFRSPGGIWARYQPVYFDQFLSSADARHEYWRQKCEAHRTFLDASPNVAHQVLAKWEQSGGMAGVITQNIDGLHTLAGSRHVLELHGTARKIGCLDCGAQYDPDPLVKQFLSTSRVPDCQNCGGRLKTATISFGQALPLEVLERSTQMARQCDLMLVLGSSLVVYPAASLPELACQSGARLVIVNRDPTPLDAKADLVLNQPIGQTLARIDALLQARRP